MMGIPCGFDACVCLYGWGLASLDQIAAELHLLAQHKAQHLISLTMLFMP
jgi:hypothetical protein